MAQPKHRSRHKVRDAHFRESSDGSIEDDLARNHSKDLEVLTGRAGSAATTDSDSLRSFFPTSCQWHFEYRTCLVEGEMGFLEWTPRSSTAEVNDGADRYLIKDDPIVAQKIHYTVKPRRQVWLQR